MLGKGHCRREYCKGSGAWDGMGFGVPHGGCGRGRPYIKILMQKLG